MCTGMPASAKRRAAVAPAGPEQVIPDRQNNREIAAHRAVERRPGVLDIVVQPVVLRPDHQMLPEPAQAEPHIGVRQAFDQPERDHY